MITRFTNFDVKVLPSNVAVITFDMPDSKMNVLSQALMAELSAQLDILASDSTLKGLVLISGKDDCFFAGANLEEIVQIQTQPSLVAYNATMSGKAVFAKLAALPFPTVAAINGVCLGGGLELALACQYRLATDNPRTKLGLPEVGLGFLPGWGGCVRLPKLIGVKAALGLILQPLKTWDAQTAWDNGTVDELVTGDASLVQRAEQVALTSEVNRAAQSIKTRALRSLMEGNKLGRMVLGSFATKSVYAETRGNYPAPPAALKVVLSSLTQPADKVFDMESQVFARLATSPESRNLVGFYFATQESKKAPLSATKPLKVRKVGVLGAGVMGAGIVQAALYAGFPVVLYDKFQAGLDKGVATIKELFDSLVSKGKMTRVDADAKLANLTATLSYEALAGCDIVVEAIVENMGVKKAALAELERVVGQPFIFATNTSSLSVSEMASNAKNPENVGGLHFFNPVYKMPLVEVVAGKQTSSETVAALKAFASRLGKTTVTTADAPGFVVNRILAPYMYEAIRLMESGVAIEDIDTAMKRYGMPMGPLALLDEVGLDIATKVIHVLNESLGARLAPPAILTFIENSKLLGKKGGKGIYLYNAQGKPTGLNPEFVAALGVEQPKPVYIKTGWRKFVPYTKPNTLKKRPVRTDVADRLSLLMINEAARCIEEGVITDASQLDLAMIMGTGFPPFRGGVLRYADQLGARTVVQSLKQLAQVAGENYTPSADLVRKAASGERFYN